MLIRITIEHRDGSKEEAVLGLTASETAQVTTAAAAEDTTVALWVRDALEHQLQTNLGISE